MVTRVMFQQGQCIEKPTLPSVTRIDVSKSCRESIVDYGPPDDIWQMGAGRRDSAVMSRDQSSSRSLSSTQPCIVQPRSTVTIDSLTICKAENGVRLPRLAIIFFLDLRSIIVAPPRYLHFLLISCAWKGASFVLYDPIETSLDQSDLLLT